METETMVITEMDTFSIRTMDFQMHGREWSLVSWDEGATWRLQMVDWYENGDKYVAHVDDYDSLFDAMKDVFEHTVEYNYRDLTG